MSIFRPSLNPNHQTEQIVQFLAELMQATMEHQVMLQISSFVV